MSPKKAMQLVIEKNDVVSRQIENLCKFNCKRSIRKNAETLNISIPHAKMFAKKYGLPYRSSDREISASEIQRIKYLQNIGLKNSEISRVVKRAYTAISPYLENNAKKNGRKK